MTHEKSELQDHLNGTSNQPNNDSVLLTLSMGFLWDYSDGANLPSRITVSDVHLTISITVYDAHLPLHVVS